jgi:hypothetical protein
MLPRVMRRLALALLGLLFGCAAGGGTAPEGPPLLFVRPRGVWAPEDLHRDVSECIDASHAAVLADPSQLGAPPGSARQALREQIVVCMDERGWATGSSVEPEEWAE